MLRTWSHRTNRHCNF